VATTRSRPRGRESARPSSGGVATEHASKIYGVVIGGTVVIIAFLALTSVGHVIDAATQRFMLYYAGVFSLIALCASVGLGLVATDRMILNPGHRIFVQSAHRAASFGALAFLVIHIVTEILAQRVHALDAFVPFLSPFRTFYIGLGTIASDLILLLVITGIMRKRFTANSKAWRWRAIHYTSYLAFVFGVWHGLLGGRPGMPYVDWSYGFVVVIVALGLAVRILANSLRPKENLSSPPVTESVSSGSAPLRAASMFAQLGIVRAASQSALAARSGPQPMLSAPVDGWDAGPVSGPMPALTALPAGPAQYAGAQYGGAQYGDVQYGNDDGRQPFYEPGYEGPPRYLGAPRNSGPMPRATTGPMPRATSGPMPRATSGPMPRATTGPMPRATTGPMPRADGTARPPDPSQPGNGAAPRRRTGPMPRAAGGPVPGAGTGPMPRAAPGPLPRAATGPMPAARPGYVAGPVGGSAPRAGTGPMPRAATGPMPRAATGPMPRAGTGPMPRPGTSMPPPGWPRPGGRGGAPPRGGQPGGTGVRGPVYRSAAGWDGPGAPGAPGAPSAPGGWGDPRRGAVNWSYDLPPWDGGAPEPDPTLRYREPGPGMPGYRGYRGGDGLR
jgi:DMSO/TMAO reductase YedYZ heme-binding membrane subunit